MKPFDFGEPPVKTKLLDFQEKSQFLDFKENSQFLDFKDPQKDDDQIVFKPERMYSSDRSPSLKPEK